MTELAVAMARAAEWASFTGARKICWRQRELRTTGARSITKIRIFDYDATVVKKLDEAAPVTLCEKLSWAEPALGESLVEGHDACPPGAKGSPPAAPRPARALSVAAGESHWQWTETRVDPSPMNDKGPQDCAQPMAGLQLRRHAVCPESCSYDKLCPMPEAVERWIDINTQAVHGGDKNDPSARNVAIFAGTRWI